MKTLFSLFFLFTVSLFPNDVTTTHLLNCKNLEIEYKATAGSIPLKDEKDEALAEIFFVSYTVESSSKRPVYFIFNGGPGSSSIWLHMGAFGPKKALSPDEHQRYSPPYQLVDNPFSLLETADLVFIDPIGTGFSTVINDEMKDHYYGIGEDAKSIAEFVQSYLTKYDRWLSPKYLMGESYGGIRAILAAEVLQDKYGIFLNGLVLISPVISLRNYQWGSSISDHLSYALYLPSYSATAWYHQLLPDELQDLSLEELIEYTRQFALTEYSLSLIQGDLLDDAKRDMIIENLSKLTAIPPDLIEKNNLRIDEQTFIYHLLPNDKRTDIASIVGAHDTRVKGYNSEPTFMGFSENPSLTNIEGSFTALMNNYLRSELNYQKDQPYKIFNMEANAKWKWYYHFHQDAISLDLSDTLRHLLVTNPNLNIFVTCGVYDIATPFSNTKYDIDHLNLPTKLRHNISYKCYEAGHMIYLNPKAHEELTDDIIHWMEK